jgi:hypothetical protein
MKKSCVEFSAWQPDRRRILGRSWRLGRRRRHPFSVCFFDISQLLFYVSWRWRRKITIVEELIGFLTLTLSLFNRLLLSLLPIETHVFNHYYYPSIEAEENRFQEVSTFREIDNWDMCVWLSFELGLFSWIFLIDLLIWYLRRNRMPIRLKDFLLTVRNFNLKLTLMILSSQTTTA